MPTIRWGIIGCGDVTEVKSGPGFQQAKGSELVAVMRRNPDKAADYARRHNVPRWYSDPDQLIHDKEVDAVYIATPPGSHELYAMKVLAAGKPCYVEKPMARNAAEARRMVEAFKSKNLPLFVAYYRRAMPRFLKVKELLATHALGRIQSAAWTYSDSQMFHPLKEIPWRLRPEESGGGLFLDLASHALDALDFWLGPLSIVHARAANTSRTCAVEDSVSLAFTAKGGIAGTVSCNFCAPPSGDDFSIVGEKAQLRMSCFGNEMIRLIQPDGRIQTFDIPKPPTVQLPLIQSIVNDLLGLGKSPSTGQSALRTQQVMDDALTDYYGGREDNFWLRAHPGINTP